MKITYSILWFDDTDEYFESLDLDPLKEIIRSWGFSPIIILVTDPDEFLSHQPFREFDLIVVDYNLEEYETHGEIFIKKIRDHDVFTEVVFYSANPTSELWNAVRDQELEGVFVASRQNQGVITKIEKVAAQSVRKVLDLENVRGIVMAEVGNIDIRLDTIINSVFTQLSDENQKSIFFKYVGRITDQKQKNIDTVKSLTDENVIKDLLEYCDSNKKWNLFQSIGKQHSDIDIKSMGNYLEDVLQPRNFLAHGIPSKNEDGSLLFVHNNNEYIFNEETSAVLRSLLNKYSQKFDEIINQLT